MAFDPTQPGGRQPDLHGLEEDADIPSPPHRLGADPLDEEAEHRLQRMARRGRALPTLLVVAAIGAFGAIVWWAYDTANQPGSPDDIPVVEADPGAEKVRPESEGGMDVPNQDKLIYQQLGQSGSATGAGAAGVERLLPPPEEPLEPPAPPPPSAATEPVPATAALTPPPPPQDTPDEVVPDTPAEEAAAAADGEVAPPAEEATAPAEEATESADAAPPAAPVAESAPVAEPAAPPPAAPEPAAQQPAPQVAAAGGFRIQLAAVKSEADAEREWARLQQTYAELLGPLTKTIQRAQLDQGVFYRIQGGPLPSREAADALCAKLKQQNQACLVVKP